MSKKTAKKFSRKVIFSFVVIISTLLSEGVFAKIPPNAFKGVTGCFMGGQKHCSPTLGAAALEIGLIHNLRFYGNYTPAYNQNGMRNYARDSSQDDPVWNMVRILFPSVGRSLGTDTGALSNFARYVDNPKTSALLLNLAKVYRENRLQLIKEEEKVEFIKKWKQTIFSSLNDAPTYAEKTSNRLVEQIVKSIDLEVESSESRPLYPIYTTEQILSSFFCYKFNTQEDIRILLKNLDDSIVDKTKIPEKMSEWQYDDLKLLVKQEEPYDMDAVFALATADFWFLPIPYREGSSPLSHGNVNKYNREKNEYIENETFSDCVEVSLRHLTNLFLYNPSIREFDLKNISTYVKPDNHYFKNFAEFYKQQSPSLANAGDTEMRLLWNKVIADLNGHSDDPVQIKYIKKDNEVSSGFINIMKVFQKVFDLKIDPAPTEGLELKRFWIEEAFEELFSALNPGKIISIADLDKLVDDGKDISGSLPIIVKSSDGKEEFSFTLASQVGVHTEITDLKNLRDKKDLEEFTLSLDSHPAMIADNTTQESLWLLLPNTEMATSKIHFPLYSLFNQMMADSRLKINLLKVINKNFNSLERDLIQNHGAAFKRILCNVLNDISWEDQDVLQTISPLILNLARRRGLGEILFKNVKKLWLEDILRVNEVMKFKNLEFLCLRNSNNVQEISLIELKKIRFLSLSELNIQTINGLEVLKKLEYLNLEETENLENLSLHGLKNLTDLKLSCSGVQTINGLETLKKLTSLDLTSTVNLKDLSLDGLENLETVDLFNSGVHALFLGDLKKLEELNLRRTKNLQVVSLSGYENLKFLDIRQSCIQRVKLDSLKKLESISIDSADKLIELSMSRLDRLKHLELSNSCVQEIGIDTLNNLTYLCLRGMYKIEKLSLKDIPNLLDLNLTHSNVKNITLNNLENLKKFCLSLSHIFEDISLSRLKSLEHLDISSSMVQRVFLDNLEGLKVLNLKQTKKLKEVSLNELISLKTINLNRSNVYTLHLKGLSDIEEVDLKNMPNLKSLVFKGDFPRLKQILLNSSEISEIQGLEGVENLQVLQLPIASNLRSLTLGEKNTDLKITGAWKHIQIQYATTSKKTNKIEDDHSFER